MSSDPISIPSPSAMSPETTITSSLLGGSAILLIFATCLYSSDLMRWLSRKHYQYEVTFSLYMLTPTEKFIFNSFLFLFLSLIIIASSLYLPEHLSKLASRAFYYYAGGPEDTHNTPPTMPNSPSPLPLSSQNSQQAFAESASLLHAAEATVAALKAAAAATAAAVGRGEEA
ncbi:hypothetical protein K402DRAFT_390407 [Aulographum hederae CBS 113979]|uniref:Uncharacterized protein n=1 Tax=Aulographum hederae CBS 113979 TaxID=1176131 RepID=A0A6G1HAX1_9PEZI|nr:hypothetical protein K402DRAFT_390407 [Aulographum hederae CBS 113979]